MKFLHTADWQLGKPFAGVEDSHKRALLQQERIEVIKRIGQVAKEHQAEFVLVAGDVFDSSRTDKSTVASACSAIGQLALPILLIPGNHDHAGPGSIWEQDFFKQEQTALAPNLKILLKPEVFELENCFIFPCPLARRAETADTTTWLRELDVYSACEGQKPRIILAHGSTQMFTSHAEREDDDLGSANHINVDQLTESEYDYLALGDWHGTKKVAEKAWYSGTPEIDRFPKGEDNDPGNVLIVEVQRGQIPAVEKVKTGEFHWRDIAFDFADDKGPERLSEKLNEELGQRANEDLLRLELTGSLGIEASTELQKLLESLRARLLRLRLKDRTSVAPTEEEIQNLTSQTSDPLVARVAQQLLDEAVGSDESAEIARIAIRELHGAHAGPNPSTAS